MSPTPALSSYIPDTSIFQAKYLVYGTLIYITCRLTYATILYPRFFSPLRKIPGPPVGIPLIGTAPEVIKGEPGVPIRNWVNKYGSVVRTVGIFGLERVMFTTPEALEQIFVDGWLDFPRPAFARHLLGLVAGYGLLTVTGEEHKQMRKAIIPAFSIPNLMAQTDMYYDAIEGLVGILRAEIQAESSGSKVFPVFKWMGKATLDIICATAFGYHTDSLHDPHNALAVAYEELVALQSAGNLATFILVLQIPYVPKLLRTEWAYRNRRVFSYIPLLGSLTTLLNSMHIIKSISRDILREKMIEAEADGSHAIQDSDMLLGGKRDIMSLLVRARRAEGKKGLGEKKAYVMSDDAMVEQVLTFLGAGHETTASSLTWTLWLLANDLQAQQRLRDEVTPFIDANARPDYRTLKNMSWLDCVFMESLRLFPPAPAVVREAASDQYVDGVFIPKGTSLAIEIRAISSLKGIWGEDAEEFHPERWLNLPDTYNSTYSFLTFITGPHGCTGKTMAIMEAKAVLASLIANFVFEPAYVGQVAQPTAAITMKPKDNMPLKISCVEGR